MITKKSILKLLTCLLVVFSLFTLAQAYYSAYIHMSLLILCFLLYPAVPRKTVNFLVSGILICAVFVVLALCKNNNTVMDHIGFFLHYLTWPFLFICVVSRYTVKEIKHLLYFIIVLCIIGNILSLIQLNINPDISRLLAGIHLEDEKIEYYKLGVGGYGYVFAMSFLMYGAIRWLKSTNNSAEKVFLTIFVMLNSIFILYAAYTSAIIIALTLIGFALISRANPSYRNVIIFIVSLLILLLRTPILEACYYLADNLGVAWVAKRFNQLLQAQVTNDLSALKRFELYALSWRSFLSNPIMGGTEFGGHSQILDTFAQYGIFALLLPVFFSCCRSLCSKAIDKSALNVLYIVFIIFTCIDTCSVMQIPVVVFFVVPLILYVERVKL